MIIVIIIIITTTTTIIILIIIIIITFDQLLQYNFLFLKFFGLVTIYFDPT